MHEDEIDRSVGSLMDESYSKRIRQWSVIDFVTSIHIEGRIGQ